MVADRTLDVEIAPADAARQCWRDNPSRPVGKIGDAGWRLESHKSAENIVSVFFIGAEQALFNGDEIPIEETRFRS